MEEVNVCSITVNSYTRIPYYCQSIPAVAVWYSARLAIARLWVRIPPVAAVFQHLLSVPSLRGQLMSTSESWGVNGHTTRIRGLAASAGVQLRAKETEISVAPWTFEAWEGLYLTMVFENTTQNFTPGFNVSDGYAPLPSPPTHVAQTDPRYFFNKLHFYCCAFTLVAQN